MLLLEYSILSIDPPLCCVVFFKCWNFPEDERRTPALKLLKYLRRCCLPIDHDIGLNLIFSERLHTEEVFFQCAVEIGQYIGTDLDTACALQILPDQSELICQVIFRIVPCKMNPFPFDLVDVFDLLFCQESRVKPLGEVYIGFACREVIHMHLPFAACCQIRVEQDNVLLP